MRPILTYERKLNELFPPDNAASSWMLRLAILRDDLEHEFNELGGAEQKPEADAKPSTVSLWRTVYAARKISITLDEIRNVFVRDARDFVQGRKLLGLIPADAPFKLAVELVDDACADLKVVRDRVGAHVRPSNRTGGVDPTPDILRAHGDSPLTLRLDPMLATGTSLHELNLAALLFAWPDVVTAADVDARLEATIHKVHHAYVAATRAIDVLLALFWGMPTDIKLEPI